jgi:predicted DNA binding CopG/RHH family protein
MVKLDKEEKDLFRSVEKGEWKSVQNLEAEIREAKSIADATVTKTQRMNIRIAEKDLIALRVRAWFAAPAGLILWVISTLQWG